MVFLRLLVIRLGSSGVMILKPPFHMGNVSSGLAAPVPITVEAGLP
jgi:hypothetical protein